jgi:hypothetical protein
MIRFILVALVLLVAPGLVAARTLWPESVKLAYIERCAESMASQGLLLKTAKSYCSCIADGMNNEFGMEEYDQMMKAEPKSNGSPYDQRLYRAFSACSSILPK